MSTIEARFWAKVSEVKDSGCWAWQAYRNANGYGSFSFRHGKTKTTALAHRWAYEQMVGPIPEGLVIDHLCRNRACVNPDHLDPVPMRINTLRGETLPAENLLKTHCIRGHRFTPENTYRDPDGNRECRTCIRAKCDDEDRRAYQRERMRKKRQDPEYLERHRNYMRALRARQKAEASDGRPDA